MTEVTFPETVFKSYPTGSRYICNPAPTDTDNDIVFLVNGYYDWRQTLIDDGWEPCGDYNNGHAPFEAFRKGEDNYIVTEDPDFFDKFVKATEAAKALNLTDKKDRIKLFEAVFNAHPGYDGFRTDFKTRKVGGIADALGWQVGAIWEVYGGRVAQVRQAEDRIGGLVGMDMANLERRALGWAADGRGPGFDIL